MPTTYGNQSQHWRSSCTVDVSLDADNRNANVRVRVYMCSISWGFSISSGISASFSSAGGNGGYNGGFHTDHLSSQSRRLIDKTVKIARKQGDFSTTIRYSVKNSSGYCNGTSSGSVTVTIPSLARHTVKFNLNGGSGNFPNLTKWYGYQLYIHKSTPTRPLYEFVDWTGGGRHYRPGDRYDPDADVTLTANWKLAWVRPALTDVSAQRCDESGIPDDEGTHAKISCHYEVKQAGVSGGVITVQKRKHNTGAYAQVLSEEVTDVSGDWSAILADFSVAESYDLLVSFSDRTQGVSQIGFISQSFVPLEFLRGGHAASFGAHVPDGVTSGLYSAGFPVLLKDGSNVSYDNGQGVITQLFNCGVVLYESQTPRLGGPVTLSDSLANYRCIEVYFSTNDGDAGGMVKVRNPNGKTFICQSSIVAPQSETNPAWRGIVKTKVYMASGTTINTVQRRGDFATGEISLVNGSTNVVVHRYDAIGITCVIGYK
ncbi:InlB B-repeat-containing protein [uncultured Olegusella sp.]|uniref:InlB B-repeat-containing protein n=1 Tax=uncultured Olegusella sp. TaxID=1979846 RepID=UPI002627EBA1|nr:InlB B-repeat-containing protein [uncultured Olegusella sp.]